MNVQPGNLARVVAPYAEQGRGALVNVIRRAEPPAEEFGRLQCSVPFDRIVWVVQGFVRDAFGQPRGPLLCIFDHCLKRVDDDDPIDGTSTPRELEAA